VYSQNHSTTWRTDGTDSFPHARDSLCSEPSDSEPGTPVQTHLRYRDALRLAAHAGPSEPEVSRSSVGSFGETVILYYTCIGKRLRCNASSTQALTRRQASV